MKLVLCFCLASFALAWVQVADAGVRVAFVVGNSDYLFIPKLTNPRNDAQDVSASLRALGFEVVGGVDLDRRTFIEELTKFGRSLGNSDVALFFYAGHGLQVNGENYLVPTDARIEFQEEIDLFLLSLKDIVRQMDRGTHAKIIFLDACRDNPFATSLSRNLDRSAVSIGQGLGRVKTKKGSFIAFATEPDSVAADGQGRNSSFTSALLRHLGVPGVPISEMMIQVRNDVIAATGEKQTPWDSSSLVENVYLAGHPGAATAGPKIAVLPATSNLGLRGPLSSGDEIAYQSAVSVDTCGAYDAYIKRSPDSLYTDFARERLIKLCPGKNKLDSDADPKPEVVANAPLPSSDGPLSRSIPEEIIDTVGRRVKIRPLPGDDRDIGWVYINSCGASDREVKKLRAAINGYQFKNLRLVPGTVREFGFADHPACRADTTIKAYANSDRGALGGFADRAAREIAAILQSRDIDTRLEREIDVSSISDRYRLDVWLVPSD